MAIAPKGVNNIWIKTTGRNIWWKPMQTRFSVGGSYAYLKNTADAQDVCQTVFVKLLTVPVDFESREHEKAWILRTSANVCK